MFNETGFTRPGLIANTLAFHSDQEIVVKTFF